MMNHKAQEFRKILLVGLTCLIVLFVAPGAGRAMESEEESKERSSTKMEVNIKEKRMDAVLSSQQVYRLSEDIEILDTKGRAIDIRKLMAPCRAEIDYQPVQGGDPVVIRIKVLKLLPGATSRFPRSVPE